MGELLREEPGELPVVGVLQLVASEQSYDTFACVECTLGRKAVDGSVLGTGENVRLTELDFIERALGVQVHAEAAVTVEVAVLVGEVQVQFLIDNLQRGSDSHLGTISLEHLREP